MTIFSRRTLQRIIDENALFLSKKQLGKHIEMLNKSDLSYEWEIVILNVFSKLGKLRHEPIFDNCKRKIDTLFNSENGNFEFLADITCILGKKDDANLIVSFEKELKTIDVPIKFCRKSGSLKIYSGYEV